MQKKWLQLISKLVTLLAFIASKSDLSMLCLSLLCTSSFWWPVLKLDIFWWFAVPKIKIFFKYFNYILWWVHIHCVKLGNFDFCIWEKPFFLCINPTILYWTFPVNRKEGFTGTLNLCFSYFTHLKNKQTKHLYSQRHLEKLV